ncbi:hypothetical protein IMZ48_37100 [Candidatus Bathyarchaeota archaeon]|nr:hypothetical protein [Candidatus Bathyarchaeota archaeon]
MYHEEVDSEAVLLVPGTEVQELSETVAIDDDVDVVEAKPGVHLGRGSEQRLKGIFGRTCEVLALGIRIHVVWEGYWQGNILP